MSIGRSGPLSGIATVTFGSAYEGPPGCVHGGYVAAAFDEMLGFVQSLGGNPGMTARLTEATLPAGVRPGTGPVSI